MRKVIFVGALLLGTGLLFCELTIREQKYRSTHDRDYRPKIVTSVNLDPSEVTVADGRRFLHAGYGATTGFDGKRLNYTLKDQNKGLVGEFQVDEYGNLFVEYVEFKISEQAGFVKTKSALLRVQRMTWDFDFLKAP